MLPQGAISVMFLSFVTRVPPSSGWYPLLRMRSSPSTSTKIGELVTILTGGRICHAASAERSAFAESTEHLHLLQAGLPCAVCTIFPRLK